MILFSIFLMLVISLVSASITGMIEGSFDYLESNSKASEIIDLRYVFITQKLIIGTLISFVFINMMGVIAIPYIISNLFISLFFYKKSILYFREKPSVSSKFSTSAFSLISDPMTSSLLFGISMQMFIYLFILK